MRRRIESELSRFMRAKLPTAILKYPTGRYGLVGSIPAALTRPATSGTPQYPPLRVSMVWDTEQDVIDALLAIGVTRFQLADCSWYGEGR